MRAPCTSIFIILSSGVRADLQYYSEYQPHPCHAVPQRMGMSVALAGSRRELKYSAVRHQARGDTFKRHYSLGLLHRATVGQLIANVLEKCHGMGLPLAVLLLRSDGEGSLAGRHAASRCRARSLSSLGTG